jgi:hypothetical protein
VPNFVGNYIFSFLMKGTEEYTKYEHLTIFPSN